MDVLIAIFFSCDSPKSKATSMHHITRKKHNSHKEFKCRNDESNHFHSLYTFLLSIPAAYNLWDMPVQKQCMVCFWYHCKHQNQNLYEQLEEHLANAKSYVRPCMLAQILSIAEQPSESTSLSVYISLRRCKKIFYIIQLPMLLSDHIRNTITITTQAL